MIPVKIKKYGFWLFAFLVFSWGTPFMVQAALLEEPSLPLEAPSLTSEFEYSQHTQTSIFDKANESQTWARIPINNTFSIKNLNTNHKILTNLQSTLEDTLRTYEGTWAVYVKNLDTRETLTINNSALYAASVIKPYVMASTFQQIANGDLEMTANVDTLLNEMITISSNDAFNTLVSMQTPSNDFTDGTKYINHYLKAHGYSHTTCNHSLSPAVMPASGTGTNTTSVEDCGLLLERMYLGECVSPEYSAQMLNYMKQIIPEDQNKIPAPLPAGTVVAHKIGNTDDTQHDVGIVYSPKATYIICVLSTQVTEKNGVAGIQQISKLVYDYFNS